MDYKPVLGGYRLTEALGVEPGELANEEDVTILEEREGNKVRVVGQYDDYTLEISYDTTRLDDAYRLILEGWDGISNSAPAFVERGRGVRKPQKDMDFCGRRCRQNYHSYPSWRASSASLDEPSMR